MLLTPRLDRPLVSVRYLASVLGWRPVDLEAVAQKAGRYYRPFDRRRQRGVGKWRHIDNPIDDLKSIQRRIHSRILRHIVFPPEYCGGLQGKSIVDNAAFHLRSPVIVCLDLKNCFPSITNKMVFAALRRDLQASIDVASLLTRLTTLQQRLPQGAPTSPVLANLTLMPMYTEVHRVASALDCTVSFYIDDITISGRRAREVIGAVAAIAHRNGFAISSRKKQILPRYKQQRVTGVVVNRKASISRVTRASIRHHIMELADSPIVTDAELRSLRGQINSVQMVNPHQGQVLARFAENLLPSHGEGGSVAKTYETRPCDGFRRDHAG